MGCNARVEGNLQVIIGEQKWQRQRIIGETVESQDIINEQRSWWMVELRFRTQMSDSKSMLCYAPPLLA